MICFIERFYTASAGTGNLSQLNVKETEFWSSAFLAVTGHKSRARVNQAGLGMNPNFVNALIQRGAFRCTASAS